MNNTTCTTCNGWNCMACAAATAHTMCLTDCPACEDHRLDQEDAWATTVESLIHEEALEVNQSVTTMCEQALAGWLR